MSAFEQKEVTLTFVPAIAVMNEDGSITEPIITIYSDEPSQTYAFPFLTKRIIQIYTNVLFPFINWEMDYSPERVVITVPISDLDRLDELRDRVNFDVNGGQDWGNLALDGETIAYGLTKIVDELEEGGKILYIPLIENITWI